MAATRDISGEMVRLAKTLEFLAGTPSIEDGARIEGIIQDVSDHMDTIGQTMGAMKASIDNIEKQMPALELCDKPKVAPVTPEITQAMTTFLRSNGLTTGSIGHMDLHLLHGILISTGGTLFASRKECRRELRRIFKWDEPAIGDFETI